MKIKLLLLAILFISCSKDDVNDSLNDDLNIDPYGENCGAQGCKVYALKYYDAQANIQETTAVLKCGLDIPGSDTEAFMSRPQTKEAFFKFIGENKCNN